MANNPELDGMLNAVKSILAENPVKNFDTYIEKLRKTYPFPNSATMPRDIKTMMYTAQLENRILQGEDPEFVYKSQIYGYRNSDWREVRKGHIEYIKEFIKNKSQS